MKTSSRRLSLVVALLFFAFPVMVHAQRQPDATTVLNNMFRVYSRLASYQDEGILVMTDEDATGGTIEKMPFKTFFKRPNRFRFEWTDYGVTKLGRTKMIWFNGKEAFMYWEPDNYEKEKSLSLAVAGATGISHRSVNTVSDLVMPEELGPSSLRRLEKRSLLGEDVFEGVLCYRLKGTDGGEQVELWIGKSDFLIRKLRREEKSGDKASSREEVRRKIQINQPITEVVFNYKPPIPLTTRTEADAEALNKLLNPGPPIWSEFRSEEGRFSVSMPQKPVSQASTMETAQGRFEQHAFIAAHDTLVCMVSYTDIPKQLLVSNDVDGFFQGVRDQFIKGVGGKLASETSLALDGHPGRELKVQMFRGELRLRMFLVRDRLYVVSLTRLDKFFEPKDEALDKFFSSFKLTPVSKSIAALPVRRDATV